MFRHEQFHIRNVFVLINAVIAEVGTEPDSSGFALHCHQFIVRFLATDSKPSGSLPQHDSCTANPSGMIKNGKNVVSPFTAISSVQTAQ